MKRTRKATIKPHKKQQQPCCFRTPFILIICGIIVTMLLLFLSIEVTLVVDDHDKNDRQPTRRRRTASSSTSNSAGRIPPMPVGVKHIATRVTIKEDPRGGRGEEVNKRMDLPPHPQHASGGAYDQQLREQLPEIPFDDMEAIDVIEVLDIIGPKMPSDDPKSIPHHVVYTTYIRAKTGEALRESERRAFLHERRKEEQKKRHSYNK